MNSSLSIRNQHCPNHVCPQFQKEHAGNVLSHSKKLRRFRCKACGITWVSRRRDPFFRFKYTEEKVNIALALLAKGVSIRRVAKRVGVSPDTIQRWKKRFVTYNYPDFFPPT